MSANPDNRGVCIVLPCYNEAENIRPMVQQLLALDPDWQILVADDNSPDGTAGVVQSLRSECPRVHLSSGEKQGLGAAYKRAMGVAMQQLGADIVVQMDADFSHDPEEVARLVQLVRGGVDIAIGSRYVAGGSIDPGWHALRRGLSGGGNWLARYIAGIRGINDCTAGFRALRASALRQIEVQRLPVNGYAFQIALLHRMLLHDMQAREHPIHFKDREHGKTKLGLSDMIEFFLAVWLLRFPSTWTFVKFSLTGLSGVVVNLLAFFLLLKMGVHKYLASPLAIELSILSNFLINNYWTFADRELFGNKLVRGLRFNAVSFGTLLISYATFLVLSALFPTGSALLHQGLAIIPAALFNYFINSYWTFSASNAGNGAAPASPARTGERGA